MSNPTTPFGWQMPQNTNLVTDLPADFEVFGQAVATSMADLLGGTTGQILAKTSNTDMDFTWTTPNPGDITGVTAGTGISGGGTSGDVTVTNSMATAIDAKGDLIVGTGADAFSRLAVGATNGHVLTVDSAEATGLKYAAAGAGSNWSLLNSGGTALTGAATVTVSGISGKDKIMVLIENASSASNSNVLYVRFNTDTGNNYYQYGFKSDLRSSYDAGTQAQIQVGSSSGILLGEMGVASALAAGFVLITGCNSAGVKVWNAGGGSTYQGSQATQQALGGYYNSASTISSVSVNTGGGNWDGGTVYVYTSAS